jgi:mannose-6-phosphate isomerase-like protein (cupin superfamily)
MNIKVIHSKNVAIERMEERDGWAISEFRLPITGATGSSTTVFRSTFRPGSTHAKHLHHKSDEVAIYLSGNGVVGQGESRAEVSAGHCRLMPKGSIHFFYNETENMDASVIGFYVNATSVADTGYKFCGMVTSEDLTHARDGLDEGILIHLKDAIKVENGLPASWKQLEVRAPIGIHNGSPNSLLHITMPPDSSTGEFQFNNTEAIYYVDSGKGNISELTHSKNIAHDSFAFVPAGIAHNLKNTGNRNLRIYLFLTGAGSLEEAI